MRPLIGIPPCLDERGRWKPGRDYHYLDAAYARAIAEAGGDAVLLAGPEDAESLAARLDGLLVPGGDDFEPDRPYPQDVRFEPVPAEKLACDRRLLGASLERDVPVLGICYGMQLLALHAGGQLHFDLSTDRPGSIGHRLDDTGRHPLRVAPGTLLSTLLGDDPEPVNSRHHQAVSGLGPDARAVAWAPDDLIEAIELPGKRFAIGLQWHPESLGPKHRERIFGGFVDSCRRRASTT